MSKIKRLLGVARVAAVSWSRRDFVFLSTEELQAEAGVVIAKMCREFDFEIESEDRLVRVLNYRLSCRYRDLLRRYYARDLSSYAPTGPLPSCVAGDPVDCTTPADHFDAIEAFREISDRLDRVGGDVEIFRHLIDHPGSSSKDIAEALGVTYGTAHMRLHRFRKCVRANLEAMR